MNRNPRIRSLVISMSIFSCIALTAKANADAYWITDLGSFLPFRINNFGQAAGNIQTGSGSGATFQAAFWTPNSANARVGTLTNINARHLGAINDYGQMVGVTENEEAILWTPSSPNAKTGTTTILDTGVDKYQNVRGLNSAGRVAYPTYDANTGLFTTHLWTPTTPNGTTGSSSPLGPFYPEAMNDKSQITGWGWFSGPGYYDALIWTPEQQYGTDGDFVLLGSLANGGRSNANDINSKGQVVGSADTGSPIFSAFLWNPTTLNTNVGVMANISTGVTVDSTAWGIDEAGTAYGTIFGSTFRAAIFRNGQVIDLNTLFTSASGIVFFTAIDANNVGQVIAYGTMGGATHGFLLTPKTTSEQIIDVRQAVANLVSLGALLPANGQSLYAKLDSANAKLAAGNKAGAITDLKAFINQVTTFVKTGKLTQAQGQALIDAANALIALISA